MPISNPYDMKVVAPYEEPRTLMEAAEAYAQEVVAEAREGRIAMFAIALDGVKKEVVSKSFEDLKKALASGPDCYNRLVGGTGGGIILVPGGMDSIVGRTGVAGRVEMDGNAAPCVAGVANVSASLDIVVNGPGAFFYGGSISGLPAALSANSSAGRAFILLHELAHVIGGLLIDDDATPSVNSRNNARIWEKCEKAISSIQ